MEIDRTPGIDWITRSEGAPSPAVYVDVDEPGHHEPLPQIRRDMAGRLAATYLRDPSTIQPQPTRPKDRAAADYGSGCDQLLAHRVSVTLRKPRGASGSDWRAIAKSQLLNRHDLNDREQLLSDTIGQHNADVSAGDRLAGTDAEDVGALPMLLIHSAA
jgi:hypothetical protein